MGFDKFRLPLGDRTFLECVLEQLLLNFDGPAICVARSQTAEAVEKIVQKLKSDRIHILTDERENSGPLEGIRVGLRAAAKDAHWGFVTSCDVPLLSKKVLQLLQKSVVSVDNDIEALVPASQSRIFGLTAFYRPRIHEKIDSLIEQNQLKVSGLATTLNSQMVDIGELKAVDPELDSLRNLNLPSHYIKFLREKGFDCPPEIEQQLNLRPEDKSIESKQN